MRKKLFASQAYFALFALLIAMMVPTQVAKAFELTNTSWTPTTTSSSYVAEARNTTLSNTLPGGLTASIAVTNEVAIASAVTPYYDSTSGITYYTDTSLSSHGGQPSHYVTGTTTNTNGVALSTYCNGCAVNTTYTNRGTITVSFSKPVTNPILNISGIGGWNRVNGYFMSIWTEYTLTTPNTTLSMLASNSQIGLDATNKKIIPVNDGTPLDADCNWSNQWKAGCGSFRINGTGSSFSFQVDYKSTTGTSGQNVTTNDTIIMTVAVQDDYGSAPASYDTTTTTHTVGDLYLGSGVTADSTTTLNATRDATGDDETNSTFKAFPSGVPKVGLADTSYSLSFPVTGTAAGKVCAWIDWNASGAFDLGERQCAAIASGTATKTLTWNVPSGITWTSTWVRLRASYDATGVESPVGRLNSGEVEDYTISVTGTAFACTTDLYQSMGTTTQSTLRRFNPTTGIYTDVGWPHTTGYNALAYNEVDNFMYAIDSAKQLIRVSSEGIVEVLGDVGLTTISPSVYNAGYFFRPNEMLVSNNGLNWQIVNVLTKTTTQITITGLNTSVGANYQGGDIVAIGTNVYYLTIDGSNLITIATTSGTTWSASLKAVSGLPTGLSSDPQRIIWGAGFTNAAGEIFYALNGTGDLYKLNNYQTVSPSAVKVASGDGVAITNNDGASCPLASAAEPISSAADTSTGAFNTTQTKNVLTNDTASTGNTLDATSVKLCAVGTTTNCALTSLTVANQGTYTVNATTGVITFTPLTTFTGTATPITYSVSDSSSAVATATYTPTVTGVPTATADTSSGAYNAAQTSNVLANDTAGSGTTLTASSVKICAAIETAPNCTLTTLTVAGEGTYTVNATTGAITFTPLATFTGTATPITYSVTDSLGQKASTTYTPTVAAPPAPSATANTSAGSSDVNQSISPLANDTAGSSSFPLLASTLQLCAVGTTSGCNLTSLTVANEGTYTVNTATGVVTFDPLPTFAGTATAITYQAADSLGRTVTSTITATVTGLPIATADTSSGAYNAAQTSTVLSNDAPPTGATLVATSVKICAANETAPNCTLTTLTIAGQGTYSVNATTGAITFTPLATFTGTATPINYSVTDSLGQKATATYTPTVAAPPAPTATANTSSGLNDVNQSISPLANDTAGSSSFPLLASTLKLCAVGTTTNCALTTLTVANEGTYTVNTTTGVVTFDPLPSFSGTATAITYEAADSLNRTVTSTITPTVSGLPVANADTSSGAYNTAQTKTVLTNDTAGTGTTLDATSVKLCAAGTTTNCALTTLTIANEGTYTVNATTGAITFTPLSTFTGTATPITYSVTDSLGQKATATYTPTVAAPPVPTATANTSSGLNDVNQSLSPLANDTAGSSSFPLLASTLKLCAVGTTTNCALTTLTVANEGTYTVNTTTGVVTFDPLPNFSGTATAITYQAADSLNRTVTSTVTPTVSGVSTANADTSSGAYNTSQSSTVLSNDTAGAGATLTATSVKICATNETAPNCTLSTLTVAGEGTYTVNATTGAITFTPLATFTGTATPITYSVTDSLGQKASTTYTPSVAAPPAPTATANTSNGLNDANQTISPLANDTAGASSYPLLASTLKLCAVGTTTGCALTTLTVANEGTYTVNTTTGVVTFDPLPTFAGTATPITYEASDSLNRVASSTITPTVSALPVLTADTSSGAYNTAQTSTVLSNDAAPTGATLVATSVKICAANETAPNCTLTTLTIAGQGTYSVNATTGAITFTPLATFTGAATPVTYSVADSLGQKASTTYTPTVAAPPLPAATANTSTGAHDVNQVINVLANDTAGASSFALDPTTVKLCATGTTTNCALTTLTVAGVGVYTVNTTTGEVTFNPAATFDGTASPVTYSVADSLGRIASSTVTVTVVPLPVATADLPTIAPYGSSVTVSPLANDTAAAGYTLVISTLKFCAVTPTAQIAPNCTVTTGSIVTVDGTYSINGSSVTFTPAAGFSGVVTAPLKYQVADSIGQIANSTISPSITAPIAAVVMPNLSSGGWNVDQPISVLQNDTPSEGATWNISTLKLCSAGQVSPNCTATSLTIAGEGTYTVNTSTGVVTFNPLDTFTGTATALSYQVTDSTNHTVTSTITPTVNVAAPVATGETQTVLPTATATFTTITGTNGLASPGAATITSVCLIVVGSSPATCDTDGIITVAGQGTYTLNSTTGVVTFVPVAGLVGGTALTPLTYQVTDSVGQKSTAALIVVTPPPPVANPNTSFGAYETAQTISPLGNDVAGSTTAPLAVSTLKLCAAGQTGLACNSTTITTAEGTYVLGAGGIVTFTPIAGYSGPEVSGVIQPVAHPISYSVQDSLGQVVTSTITATVYPQPATAAIADTGTAAWTPTVTMTVNVLSNDSKGVPPAAFTTVGNLALNPSTVHLCAPAEAAPNCTLNTLTTVEGTYTVNTSTGAVTFDPIATFSGTASIIPVYQVCNSVSGTWAISGNASPTPNSTCATSTITVTITPPPAPIATLNTSTGLQGDVQTSNLLVNDFLNSVAVSSVHLCGSGQTADTCSLTTLVVANVGTYTVNTTTGSVTFTPLPTYVGTPTPINYAFVDTLGRTATSTYTPTVTAPAPPIANPETKTTTIGTPVSFSSLSSGSGLASMGTNALSLARTCLVDPANTSVCGSSVVTADGVWSLDSVSGVVTYTPNSTTTGGTLVSVSYVVYDSTGLSATNVLTPVISSAQVTPPTVTPVSPVVPVKPVDPAPKVLPKAKPDTKIGKLNQVVTVVPILNDVKANDPLVAVSILLCTTNCAKLAETVVAPVDPTKPVDPAPTPVIAPIVTAQGTWSVDASTGIVSFTPVKNWFGRVSISYVIFDAAGNPAVSEITVTIPKPVLPKQLAYTGNAPKIVKVAAPKTASYVATIVAPRLGAKWVKKVYEGTSPTKVLNPLGIGHYETTQLPGETGNFAVAGHRLGAGGPFRNIDKFKAGDLVYVATPTGKYIYRYLQTKIVKPSEVGVLMPTPKGLTASTSANAFLTLQTCTPVGVNTDRLIVWFELIESEN